MFAASDVFLSLHLALLIGFVSVTSLLMLVTVTNRLRLRRVLVSWRAGRLFGLPVWPVLFLSVVLLFIGYALAMGHALDLSIFAGYLLGGLFWFASALLSATVVVSDYGVLQNVNHAARAIAWGQVVDYFEYARGKQKGYVFFYVDGSGGRRRLELPVPALHRQRFDAIVAAKLDARFDFSMQQTYGKKTLEG